jgi:hypothetical protein
VFTRGFPRRSVLPLPDNPQTVVCLGQFGLEVDGCLELLFGLGYHSFRPCELWLAWVVQVGEVAVTINLGISRRRFGAFNLVELLVVIAVVVVMAGMLLLSRHRPVKAERIKCVNNLKNIGLASRIFATDHQDRFPFEVLSMCQSQGSD